MLNRYGITPPSTGQNIAQAASAGAAGAANAMAANRSVGLQAAVDEEALNQHRQSQNFDQTAARERDRRESGNDAFRNMQRAEYLQTARGYQPKKRFALIRLRP